MKNKAKKIFVADDSAFMRTLITNALENEGYNVTSVSSGEEAIELLKREKPDLLLLDGIMTGMSGYDVLSVLRSDFRYNLIPIIMITAQSEETDKLKGLEMGADDYVVKPFQSRELLARVRNTLVRLERNRSANPLTGLRGNNDIENEIAERLFREDWFSIMYFDLNSFKPYNDIYGFANGDLVLKLLADVLTEAAMEHGTPGDLIGHIGGDDFVIITEPGRADDIAQCVIHEFDDRIMDFYTPADRERGFISAMDRAGNTADFGIIGISIAIVDTSQHEVLGTLHLAELAAGVKTEAKEKAEGRSAYIIL